MQVSLGECVLQLSEHSGDASPGAAVKLRTDKIEEYVAQLAAKEYPPSVAAQDRARQNNRENICIDIFLPIQKPRVSQEVL